MKKVSFVLVCLLIAAGSSLALPSYSGLRGLNRTVDARPADAGLFSIGLFTFMGFSPDERTAELSGTEVDITDTEYSGTGYITLGYGVNRSFELGANVSYLMNQVKRDDVDDRLNTSGDWNGDDGFSEAAVSMKYTVNPDAEKVWFGFMPSVHFSIYGGGDNSFVYNGDEWDGIWNTDEPMFQLRRPMMNAGSVNFGGDFLATFDLDPVTVHGNLGYHYYKQNFTFTDRRYDTSHNVVATEEVDIEVEDPVLRFAAGIEYPVNSTTLFAELEWRHFLNREFEEGDGERFDDCIQIAPGARFTFDSGLAMDITGSYCITSFDPEYNDLGHRYYQQGESLTDDERARYAPFPGGYAPAYGIGVNLMYSVDTTSRPAILSGTVTDAITGEVVVASVSLPGSEAEGISSDPVTGMYSTQLDKGTFTILAEAEGYIPANTTIDVFSGENITRDFALQPASGFVTGTVTDAGTGNGLQAVISASGDLEAVTDRSGGYAIECAAGTRTLLAVSDGYGNQSRSVEVISAHSVVQDFQLNMQLNFENVYFDYDRFELRTDARVILDQVAQVLISNPGITIMITGNTDSDGESEYNQALAEKRAEAVRNYLVSKGVGEESLSTVGYGEEKPAVPNSSDENRALNRRTEFMVLGAAIQ